jgi:hypothetical protein
MRQLGLVQAPKADYDLNRMTEQVLDARTDHIYFDFSRVIGPQYAKMVEKFSTMEGNRIAAHNNKTLFLEAIDLWGRKRLGAGQGGTRMGAASNSRRIEDPRNAVVYSMEPWYEALELDDPSKYKLKRREPPPIYVGGEAEAVATIMGLAACLDITPMRFVFGGRKENGKDNYERVWAKIKADGNWYDLDIMTPGVLGDRPDFPHYKEVEVAI